MFQTFGFYVSLTTTLVIAVTIIACSSSENSESAIPASSATVSGTESTPNSDTPSTNKDSSGIAIQQAYDLNMTFTSSKFNEKRRIPKLYTCIGGKVDRSGQSDKSGEMFARGNLTGKDAQNLSPPLAWTGTPSGTQSFAVIVHSSEAQASDEPWIHWVIWNIPPETTHLDEGISESEILDNGSVQGANSGGVVGYLGPCPPALISRHASVPGGGKNPKQEIEKYYFEVYALDSTIDLTAGSTRDSLRQAMDGHILGAGELVGERQGPLKLQLSPGGF